MPSAKSPNRDRARALAGKIIIVDGHIDVPYWMTEVCEEDISEETSGGDFDYPKARKGGLDAAFMSIFVPVRYQESGSGFDYAERLIDLVENLASDHPDKFALAMSPGDIRLNRDKGLISLPMGIENGVAIEDDLGRVEYFFDRGVRYMTLVHARDNGLADSSYDDSGTWGGLSDFGRDVVREMNRLGMMIDVSHLSDVAFFDVQDVTSQPVVATHSSARHFTPGWERNASDAVIRSIAETGGIVMINFGSDFLDGSYRETSEKKRARIYARLKSKGLKRESAEGFATLSTFRKRHPVGTVTDVVRHIRHVADLVGVDHVGLGSDFDGVFSLPKGLQDVSDFPNLIGALLDDGLSEEEIRKVCGENILRLWGRIEESAASRPD